MPTQTEQAEQLAQTCDTGLIALTRDAPISEYADVLVTAIDRLQASLDAAHCDIDKPEGS